MKNKGRRHKAGSNEKLSGMLNCKSMIGHLTRPIESMSSKGKAGDNGFSSNKFNKKKWAKRVRGYAKSQTKNIYEQESNG